MQQAELQLDQSASSIAQAGGNAAADPGNVDTVDLASQMVALMSAENAFEANAATLKTADQVEQGLLNVTA